jgi:hypothetical protein
MTLTSVETDPDAREGRAQWAWAREAPLVGLRQGILFPGLVAVHGVKQGEGTTGIAMYGERTVGGPGPVCPFWAGSMLFRVNASIKNIFFSKGMHFQNISKILSSSSNICRFVFFTNFSHSSYLK